jgi:hypothetical protein
MRKQPHEMYSIPDLMGIVEAVAQYLEANYQLSHVEVQTLLFYLERFYFWREYNDRFMGREI